MIERDPQAIHNDEGKPIEMMYSVSQGRVEHYSDVVDHMVNNEILRCKGEGKNPTQAQVDFFRKEIIRHVVIRRDIDGATKLRMKTGNNILNETNHRLPARAEL